MITVSNEKELGKALKDDVDTIEVEGDLVKKVIKIKATGKVAWGVCIACLTVAITAMIAKIVSAGFAAPITTTAIMLTAPAAIATLGTSAALAAVGIGVAGGGVAVLNKLRDYKMEETGDKIILKK